MTDAASLKQAFVEEDRRTCRPEMYAHIEFEGETDIPLETLRERTWSVTSPEFGRLYLGKINVGSAGNLWAYAYGEGLRPFLERQSIALRVNLSSLKLDEPGKPKELEADAGAPSDDNGESRPPRSGWPNILLGAWLILVGVGMWQCAR